MKLYRVLANLAFLSHWVLVGILVGGIPMQYFFPWYRGINLLLLGVTAISQLVWLGKCPLTILENHFRAKYNPAEVYTGPCIQHYFAQRFQVTVPSGFAPFMLVLMVLISGFFWIN